ncbi:MAG: putative quorum-sensing-regulated virulence factor [Syntrophobacteraceae bacterium]
MGKQHDGTMVISFGKYRGKTIEELPSGYLKWIAENVDDDDLCEAADAEYQWRSQHGTHIWD